MLKDVTWIVINEENLATVINKLKVANGEFAVYALSAEGYSNLSLNISDIRALIQQQQAIIVAYENYYQEAEEAMDNASE